MTVLVFAFRGPKFMKSWDNIGDPSQFLTLFTDCIYLVPRRQYLPSKLPLSCEVVENRYFWAPNFVGAITQKSFRSVLLSTDTRHVLKFRKDPVRGVDGIAWKKKQHLQNRCRHICGGQQAQFELKVLGPQVGYHIACTW